MKSQKCKLWIEYWAFQTTLTLLLGGHFWSVWFYIFKHGNCKILTFEIRFAPLLLSSTHMLTPNILHHKWSCHMLHVKDGQPSVTRWTSGLCDPAIGATLHRHSNRCSISCSRWLNSHLKKWFICPHMAGDERGAALSAATTTFLLSFTAPGASYFLPLILLQWRYAFIKGKRPKSSLAPKLKVGMPEHISALACRLPCVHACAHVPFVLFLNSALSLVRAMDPANKATDASTTPSPRYY